MIKSFEFYFDFSSPYSFLAHKQVRQIEKDNSIQMKYMPIFLAGLLNLSGIKPNIDIPIKAKYMIKDCKLCAEKYNIPFKFNNYFPIKSLNLMRCILVAEKKNFSQKFINKIFDAIWNEGLNLNDNMIIEKIFRNLNMDSKTFLSESIEPQIKDELKKRTKDAYNKGIFGAPSFVINNKIFWGHDRLEFAINEARK